MLHNFEFNKNIPKIKFQSNPSSSVKWWSTVSKKRKELITIKLRFRSFHGQGSGHGHVPLISFYWKKLLGLGSCTNIGTGKCCISPSCLFNTVSTSSGLQVYLIAIIQYVSWQDFKQKVIYLKRCPSSSICYPTSTMARPTIWCNSSVSCSKRLINSPIKYYEPQKCEEFSKKWSNLKMSVINKCIFWIPMEHNFEWQMW